ncbi:hypothetical protein NYR60_03075 [Actinobacillus genomosp. 2]|uniref:hypothetical protein n=1 Tax=Actinobacillus genomosp. 2 TaxID=230709 RepID=UPI002441A5ED|nr:hypothetical protein [Actinobacillus genomosp. 2]WGE32608.1 hypothetical protein NYR60_03075 [Actinobacillus genomosp. 2]
MTTQNEKFTQFAQAVGVDVKTINEKIKTIELMVNGKVSNIEIQSAIGALRNELLGGVAAEYDTLKELADKLNQLANDDNLSSAILQKFTEIRTEIDELKNVDLVTTYNQAKGA